MSEHVAEGCPAADLDRMVAVIGHELKNPLAAVRGVLQIVEARTADDPSLAMVMREVLARIDSLDELIDSLLLFATPPRPSLGPVDVVAVLHGVVTALESASGTGGCRYAVAGSAPAVLGDPRLLRTLFQHLLLNAAQAQLDGAVTIDVCAQAGAAQIVVSDTGGGFSSEARTHLYEPFFTTKARGAGLGLPTARRLASLHHGTVHVDSRNGTTRVVVRLPLADGGEC